MAQPLLDFLTGRARAALPFLRAAAAQGLSGAVAIELVRQFAQTFQRQQMLDIYAVLQNRADPERIARLVGQYAPIPNELHTPSVTQLKNPYEYVVVATDEEGEDIGALTVGSTFPLSAEEIHRRANTLFREQPAVYLSKQIGELVAQSIEEANVSSEVAP